MANFLYNTGIKLFGFAAKLAATFNPKAKLFVQGRQTVWHTLSQLNTKHVVWFHAASLGEFEQGKPIMERLKKQHPHITLLVTFFSPSGYEQRKNWPLATTCYLPLDTPTNAQRFIQLVQPKLAVFIRYEFWVNFMDELYENKIPTAVIAAQFRPDQFMFKLQGRFVLKRIAKLNSIMVQYQSAKDLLLKFGVDKHKITVCGDSRFDRVLETVNSADTIAQIAHFKAGKPMLILGSCYDKEIEFVKPFIKAHPNWKFLFAPHHVDESTVAHLEKQLPEKAVRFTNYENEDARIMILNTIGKLASAYRYGDLAIVGGGFRDGIHNILEPAAFGLPVFFGPNHSAFPEAQALINENLGVEINQDNHAKNTVTLLLGNQEEREKRAQKLRNFVQNHAGATEAISAHLNALLN